MLGWAWFSNQRREKGVKDGRIDVKWKGLKSKVRRVDTHTADVKTIMPCSVRTHEFWGKEMFLALSVALIYMAPFFFLYQALTCS